MKGNKKKKNYLPESFDQHIPSVHSKIEDARTCILMDVGNTAVIQQDTVI